MQTPGKLPFTELFHRVGMAQATMKKKKKTVFLYSPQEVGLLQGLETEVVVLEVTLLPDGRVEYLLVLTTAATQAQKSTQQRPSVHT